MTVRGAEREDCVHYHACLMETALRARGSVRCVPCLDCELYQRAEPVVRDAWRKRGGWNPDSGV